MSLTAYYAGGPPAIPNRRSEQISAPKLDRVVAAGDLATRLHTAIALRQERLQIDGPLTLHQVAAICRLPDSYLPRLREVTGR